MLKTLLAGTTALALIGSGVAYAQTRTESPAGKTPPAASQRSDAQIKADREAFLEARIAALKAGLKLTPDQQKAWPAFEKAYRDFATTRAEIWQDRMEARREAQQARKTGDAQPVDRLARLKERADATVRRGEAMKAFATAAEPLIATLDQDQTRRFWALARPMGKRFAMGGGWHHGWGHNRHHGWMRDGMGMNGMGSGRMGMQGMGPGSMGPGMGGMGGME